jgi:hypothetical protein
MQRLALFPGALALFRLQLERGGHLDVDDSTREPYLDVDDSTREPYRELARTGLMQGGCAYLTRSSALTLIGVELLRLYHLAQAA